MLDSEVAFGHRPFVDSEDNMSQFPKRRETRTSLLTAQNFEADCRLCLRFGTGFADDARTSYETQERGTPKGVK